MTLALILAGLFVGFVLWRASAPIRAGGWRVGAGLGAVLAVVVGLVMAIRGEAWLGLPLVGLGLALAYGGRTIRRARAARPVPPPAEAMSMAEARSILGVGQGAGAEEIQSAYLRLIKRIHPDQGGTEGLASKLNAARDRLMAQL